MKYKVKVTVIDKNYFLNFNSNIVWILLPEHVNVIMWVMNSFFSGMMRGMISGIWDLTRWLKQKLILILWQAGLKCRIVLRRGMQSHVISIQDCRVVPL